MIPTSSAGFHGLQRHVVLIGPEVHWNTGNIGRTCLGAGARLHLIKPLGFSLDDRHVKRAGLDYWTKVQPAIWENADHFLDTMTPADNEIALLTKSGTQPFWNMPSPSRLFLLFGSETKGLPQPVKDRFPERTYCIPISPHIRCLNLSTAVGIALYESIRRPRHCAEKPLKRS